MCCSFVYAPGLVSCPDFAYDLPLETPKSGKEAKHSLVGLLFRRQNGNVGEVTPVMSEKEDIYDDTLRFYG